MISREVCRHGERLGHACDYVDWRNAFIPLAEATANEEVGATAPEGCCAAEADRWSWKWDAAYHRAMKKLTTDPFAVPRFVVSAPAEAPAGDGGGS